MRSQSLGRKLAPYAYLSPALISIALLSLGPVIFTIFLAFTDASLYTFRSGISPVGLENFKEIFTGPFSQVFFPVLGWNIVYATLATISCYVVGMLIAMLLNNPFMWESRLYRSLLIIPWAIPATIAVLAWKGLFHTSAGTINLWLGELFHMAPIPWLENPTLARAAVLTVNLWLGFPFFMTVCLGALQSIPSEVYEAAEIDGANVWQKFRDLTFPLLLRFTLPLLIGSFAFNFNNFGAAFLMTGGGPNRPGPFQAGYTDILVSVGYKLTVNLNRYALSAALSIILFAIIVVISILNMRMTGAFKEED